MSLLGFSVTLIHSALSINKSQRATTSCGKLDTQTTTVIHDNIIVVHLLYDVLNMSSSVCVLSVLAKPLCLCVVVH